MTRQKNRKLLLIVSFLFFPVTLYYFSPVLIINAGLEGVINGSFIVFTAMIISGFFFGRVFCAWLCPAGGLQECTALVNDKAPKQGWRNYIKYGIWVIWIMSVIACYASGRQNLKLDFLYKTEMGISVSNIYGYIVYYGILFLILILSLFAGKRAFCHYICWMAPFMLIGIKIRSLLHMPGLHIAVDDKKCISCNQCSEVCPMCINAAHLALHGKSDNLECIQCGACVDICRPKAIVFRMRSRVK